MSALYRLMRIAAATPIDALMLAALLVLMAFTAVQ